MIMRFLFMLILSYVVIANASASDRKIYDIILFEDSVLSLSNLDAAIFNNEKYIDFFQTEKKNHFEVLKDYFMDFDSILVFENIYWGEYVKSPLYNVRVIDIKKDSIYKTESDSYNNRIVVSQKKNEKFQMYNKKQDISIDVICCYICYAFIDSKDSLIYIQNNSFDCTTSVSLYSLCTFISNQDHNSKTFRFGFWPLWVRSVLQNNKLRALYP